MQIEAGRMARSPGTRGWPGPGGRPRPASRARHASDCAPITDSSRSFSALSEPGAAV